MQTSVYSRSQLTDMIRPLLKKYRADHALLFGSYARNEATIASDIDLVVVGTPEFQPFDIFAIAEELHENSGKSVDVYEISEIAQHSPIYNAIMTDGVVVK